MILHHRGQSVETDAAAEVVDLMDADVCAHPLQDGRQVIVRAAMKSCVVQGPILLRGPPRSNSVPAPPAIETAAE